MVSMKIWGCEEKNHPRVADSKTIAATLEIPIGGSRVFSRLFSSVFLSDRLYVFLAVNPFLTVIIIIGIIGDCTF